MTVLLTGVAALLVSLVAGLVIVAHAFQRSVGSGFIVLLVPGYSVYYAFSQFEHSKKGLILSAWLGLGILGAFLVLGGRQLAA